MKQVRFTVIHITSLRIVHTPLISLLRQVYATPYGDYHCIAAAIGQDDEAATDKPSIRQAAMESHAEQHHMLRKERRRKRQAASPSPKDQLDEDPADYYQHAEHRHEKQPRLGSTPPPTPSPVGQASRDSSHVCSQLKGEDADHSPLPRPAACRRQAGRVTSDNEEEEDAFIRPHDEEIEDARPMRMLLDNYNSGSDDDLYASH